MEKFKLLLLILLISAISINCSEYNLSKKVYGFHPSWISDDIAKNYDWSAIHTLIYYGFEVDCTNGTASTVYKWRTSKAIDYAKANGVKVQLLVALFGESENEALLADSVKCDTLISNIIKEVKYRDADGVNIDFEAVPASQKNNLVRFLRNLKNRLNNYIPKSELTIDGPAVDWRESWDFEKINEIVDYIILMGYDYHWSTSTEAGAVAPMGGSYWNVVSSTEYYLNNGVSADKLLLGVPWYGYDWQVESLVKGAKTLDAATAYRYSGCKKKADEYGSVFDTATKSKYIAYTENEQFRQLWYDDSLTLSFKYNLINEKKIAGTAIWALGYQGDTPELWNALKAAFTPTESVPFLADNKIVIYPNPCDGNLFIKTDIVFDKLEIYDFMGGKAFETSISANSLKIDLKNLNTGYYTLILQNNDIKEIKSILIYK